MATSLDTEAFHNSINLTHRAYEEYQTKNFTEQGNVTVRKTIGKDATFCNNFLKGAKWSPDGKIILSCSDDGIARLYATPPSPSSDISNENTTAESLTDKATTVPTPLLPWVQVDESETIFDFCWYPLMDWAIPATCYFALTSRDHPIHLYNPHNYGFLTYLPLDAEEDLKSFVALAFHPLGDKLYGGNRNAISVFDVTRPGKPLQKYTLSTRRSKGTQRGIISCFAFQLPSPNSLVACGSYGRSIHLYDETSHMLDVLELRDTSSSWGGVTHLQWYNEHIIISGHRQDCFLRLWDIRRPLEPLHHFTRYINTHQRFIFDIYKQILVTGDQSGTVSTYNLDTFELIGSKHLQDSPLCSTMMHPKLPWLLTASGTRIFTEWDALSCDSSDTDQPCVAKMVSNQAVKEAYYPENNVSIWSLKSWLEPLKSRDELEVAEENWKQK